MTGKNYSTLTSYTRKCQGSDTLVSDTLVNTPKSTGSYWVNPCPNFSPILVSCATNNEKSIVKFFIINKLVKLNAKLQLEHYMEIVTSLFFKVFPFDIYLTASSRDNPKNPQINPLKPTQLGLLKYPDFFLNSV